MCALLMSAALWQEGAGWALRVDGEQGGGRLTSPPAHRSFPPPRNKKEKKRKRKKKLFYPHHLRQKCCRNWNHLIRYHSSLFIDYLYYNNHIWNLELNNHQQQSTTVRIDCTTRKTINHNFFNVINLKNV